MTLQCRALRHPHHLQALAAAAAAAVAGAVARASVVGARPARLRPCPGPSAAGAAHGAAPAASWLWRLWWWTSWTAARAAVWHLRRRRRQRGARAAELRSWACARRQVWHVMLAACDASTSRAAAAALPARSSECLECKAGERVITTEERRGEMHRHNEHARVRVLHGQDQAELDTEPMQPLLGRC